MDSGVAVFIVVWVVMGVLAVGSSIVWLWALVDCLKREFPEPIEKLIWILVILVLHLAGAIIYLYVGRPRADASPVRRIRPGPL